MENFKKILIFLFTVAIFSGCSKENLISQRDGRSNRGSQTEAAQPNIDIKDKLDAMFAKMPEGLQERIQTNSSLFLDLHPEYREIAHRAVDPTPCSSATDLNIWLGGQLAGWNQVIDNYGNTVFDYAVVTGMLDFPTYDALLFVNSSKNQYFGVGGEYTQASTKTFKDLRRFWEIESSGMVLGAMHGNMLQDRDRVIRIDKILFDDDQQTAEYWADLILLLLDVVPQYRNGDHPIFTFNAFALPGFPFPPYGVISDKIIMGDGIIDAYDGIGFGDVATEAVLAHEFGHHIQFQLNVFDGTSSPESTRRTELMADAFSAYYLSHAQGAAMQWKRVKQFLKVFFNIGDCSFTSDNHHGTPLQRMAAAEWGYELADDAQKQGQIISALEFIQLFDQVLPSLVQ